MDEGLWNVEGWTVGDRVRTMDGGGDFTSGAEGVSRGFLGQEVNHRLQVKGEVV